MACHASIFVSALSNRRHGLPWNTLLRNNRAFQPCLWGSLTSPKVVCFRHAEQQPTKQISWSREPRKYSYKLNLILLLFLGIQFWVFSWKKRPRRPCNYKMMHGPQDGIFPFAIFCDSGKRKALIMCLSKRHPVTSNRIIMCKLSFEYKNKSVSLLQCNTLSLFFFFFRWQPAWTWPGETCSIS